MSWWFKSRQVLGVVCLSVCLFFISCQKEKSYAVIHTDYGVLKAVLFENTPIHKKNFEKLVEEKYYDGTLFHRIIPSFMIQGGDPDSKSANTGQMLGLGGPGYELEPEISGIHLRGALAMARKGDSDNPGKKSNGSQFYIVIGHPVSAELLASVEKYKGIKYTEEQKAAYIKSGGEPNLDGDYTVFGQLVEGYDILDKLAGMPVDGNKRPFQNISMKIKIVKE